MKVLIEMERLRNPYSGLGQFCYRLGVEFSKANFENSTFFLPKNRNGVFGEICNYKTVRPWHKFFPPLERFDVWHATHQDSKYLPQKSKGNGASRLILTIHDLNFLESPNASTRQKAYKSRVLQQKIATSAGLVYISNYTKTQVHAHFDIPGDCHETVIYNGCDPLASALSLPAPPQGVSPQPDPFVFSIGIHPKKNYAAVVPILKGNSALKWVIAGSDPKNYALEILAEAKKMGLEKQLVFTGAITESEKIWLYQHCQALIFPSLAEGFGIPVAEAMYFGKPVFLSTKTSLPEIGGDLAFYFQNFEQQHVADVFVNGMATFNNTPSYPNLLKQRAGIFSWASAANAYWDFYRLVFGEKTSPPRPPLHWRGGGVIYS